MNLKLIQGTGCEDGLMIVGDYPTKEEQQNGIAFSGRSGAMIERLLGKVGVKLSQTYRTYYIKSFIEGAGARSKKKARESIDNIKLLADFDDILKREIKEVSPKAILSLGELPLELLTGERGLSKYRGSILPIHPLVGEKLYVVPTLHPRDMAENQQTYAYVPLDYKKAAEIYHGTYKPAQSLLWICRTAQELNEYWKRARTGEFLVFDVETYRNFITCIGLCTDGYESISIPLLDWTSIEDAKMIHKLLAEILHSKIPKVNQNIKFDLWMLNKWFFEVENIFGDTMQLGHLLYPELPKNLGFYTSIYTHFPYHKDEGKEYNLRVAGDTLLFYNAKDCLVTWKIHKKMEEDAKELQVWNLYQEEIMPLVSIYLKSEQRGIRTDEERRKKLLAKYEEQAETFQSVLEDMIDFTVNIRSPKQIGSLLYENLKLPVQTHITPYGNTAWSTDKETLEDLYINKVTDKSKRYILKQIILIRKLLLIIDFLKRPIHADGRVRTQVKIHGTKSGRTAGDSSVDRQHFLFEEDGQQYVDYEELGYSLQTIPKRKFEMEGFEGLVFGEDIPSMFVPSPGYVFIEGDGSQAEARVVSVLAEDWDTLALMNKKDFKRNKHGMKDDLHSLTAMWTTGKSFEDITEFDREQKGKRPRHAGNYDMGAWRLSMMIHISHLECHGILERFHSNAPKIRAIFHREIRETIDRCGVLFTPHGRRRDFFDRRTIELYKEAYSYIPQAVVSDHTKFTMRRINYDWAHPLIEKHDSLLYEVKKGREEEFEIEFKKVYERPIDFNNCSLSRNFKLVIPCELKIGEENWKEMKEVKLC